jgi:hypothetical protein
MKGLVKVLEDQITESEAGSYEVGEQRERNHRFYTLQPIGNEQKGRSQYISPDVMDAVDSKKALMDETFLGNRQVCKFKNSTGAPHEADAKTAYTNRTFRRNKHHQLFRDGWHDAFVAKREVVLVEWEVDSRTTTMTIQGAVEQQIQQQIQQMGQVIGVDGSRLQPIPPNPQMMQQRAMQAMQQGMDPRRLPPPPQMLQGEIDVELDDSYAKITLITPERYYRDPEADYPCNSQWCSWEDDITRGDLIMDGFDEEQIMGLAVDYRFRSNEEDSARKAHDSSWTRRQQYDRIDIQSHVTVYKTWTWLNLADDRWTDLDLEFEREDEIKLYKVCWAHGEVLKYAGGNHAVEEAPRMPFVEWTEMKISHAEHGMCTSDVLAHPQKTNSTLKRLIIDNQQMRNNTRYEAVLGALKNPRDLLDNKIGGVIWSRQVGSVGALPTPELSPLTFQVLQMMQADVEKRDGYSSLGKGMNQDAVKYQNADSMIERLTNAGTRRPMSTARDWANNFLVELSKMVIDLAMENDKSETQLEVRGRMVPVVPSQWKDDVNDMEVAVALTPQEGKEHGQMLLTMHSVILQDPEMAPLYTLTHKHALFDAVYDSLGVEDTTPYLARPDSPEFQKQQQEAQAKAKEMQDKQEALVMMDAKLKQSADRLGWEGFKWTQTQDMQAANDKDLEFEHQKRVDADKSRLSWMEFDWERRVDAAEVKLEQQQRRPVGVGNN